MDLNVEDIFNANDCSRGGRDGTDRKCRVQRKEQKLKTEGHQHFRNQHRWIILKRRKRRGRQKTKSMYRESQEQTFQEDCRG